MILTMSDSLKKTRSFFRWPKRFTFTCERGFFPTTPSSKRYVKNGLKQYFRRDIVLEEYGGFVHYDFGCSCKIAHNRKKMAILKIETMKFTTPDIWPPGLTYGHRDCCRPCYASLGTSGEIDQDFIRSLLAIAVLYSANIQTILTCIA